MCMRGGFHMHVCRLECLWQCMCVCVIVSAYLYHGREFNEKEETSWWKRKREEKWHEWMKRRDDIKRSNDDENIEIFLSYTSSQLKLNISINKILPYRFCLSIWRQSFALTRSRPPQVMRFSCYRAQIRVPSLHIRVAFLRTLRSCARPW